MGNLPLPITHLDSYIPTLPCTWLMMCVYVTCDAHVRDLWHSDECHTNAPANDLETAFVDILILVWWMSIPEIVESENPPLPTTHLRAYFMPVRDLWCVCMWLVVHIYVSNEVVMNTTLMYLLMPSEPCCSCLCKFVKLQEVCNLRKVLCS